MAGKLLVGAAGNLLFSGRKPAVLYGKNWLGKLKKKKNKLDEHKKKAPKGS